MLRGQFRIPRLVAIVNALETGQDTYERGDSMLTNTHTDAQNMSEKKGIKPFRVGRSAPVRFAHTVTGRRYQSITRDLGRYLITTLNTIYLLRHTPSPEYPHIQPVTYRR